MVKNLSIAVVLSGIVVVVGSMAGVLPLGSEPMEVPWRITLTLIIGFVIGASIGFVWLDELQRDTAFPWQLLSVSFVAGGICAIEFMFCQQNFESYYSIPVLLSGGVCAGSLLGASVRAL